jgi:hypothetical protein
MQAGKRESRYLISVLLVPAALLALLFIVSALHEDLIESLIDENGIIESASAFGYVACIAALLLRGGWRTAVLRAPYLSFILLFLALRELDFDKRFTTMGIFKSQFYLSASVPWAEKILAVVFLALLIWSLLELADRHWRQFLPRLLSLHPVAVAVFLAASLAVMAKSLDGLARKLDGFGLAVSEHAYLIAEGAEEVLELGIPLLLILAVFAHFGTMKEAGAGNDHP